MNEKYHEMILEKTQVHGMEEWYCPDCGRRFVMQWPPAYRMILLEAGDQETRHSVSRSSSRTGSRRDTQLEETDPIDEFRLIPFLEWMERVSFDSLWGRDA
jgi:hypothetical protein